jgi:Dpy-30 motif
MNADAEYLVSTVGPVLSQGVADCLIADPDDPVAYVGQWLKQYVKNTSATDQVRQEKAKDRANSQRVMAAAAAAKSGAQAQISHKLAVIDQV